MFRIVLREQLGAFCAVIPSGLELGNSFDP